MIFCIAWYINTFTIYIDRYSISSNAFFYNFSAYKLSCSRTRFYKAWRSCYGTYHSVDVCYGRLLNDHLFVALGNLRWQLYLWIILFSKWYLVELYLKKTFNFTIFEISFKWNAMDTITIFKNASIWLCF